MAIQVEQVPRLSPREVRERMRAGSRRVYLVCAYDDEAMYREYAIDGALSLGELERRLDSIERDAELVFYCA